MNEQRFPEPTVGALIIGPDDKLLLIKSNRWRSTWVIPGGHIELGERMEDALRREAREETGLDVYDIEFLCFQEFIFDDVFHRKAHFIFFDFMCRTDSTTVELNAEAQDYRWVSLEEALRLPLDRYMRRAVEEYARRRQ